MTAKTDTPKILKRITATPPPRERDHALLERCFLAALTGLTSQAEVQMHIDEGRGDLYSDSEESLAERNEELVCRALDIASAAEEKFREELKLRRFNHEV